MAASQTDRDAVALLERCEKGDRNAVYKLAQTIRPKNVTELVEFIWPECPPPPDKFDPIADAYNTYKTLENRF